MRDRYGDGLAERRLALLDVVDRARLVSARDVERLHEVLVFLRAYPDDDRVLSRVEAMIESFPRRGDLRRFRADLWDSGIAGTRIVFTFYWQSAGWLIRRCPRNVTIEWGEFENSERLESMLHLLVPYSETPGIDEMPWTVRQWLDAMRGPDETDAAFLVRRFAKIPGDSFLRESLWSSLSIPFRVDPGPATPTRTLARYAPSRVRFHATSLDRTRPSLRDELKRPPLGVRSVSRKEGERLIDLAREAMATRSRDLDAFANADPDDVRIVDCGDGLEFACIGQVPERRLMFESVYGYLTLKSGVPIGYVLSAALFESAEIAYNVFETYRGGEAARIFGRVVSMVHHIFGARAFSIDPYQLGGLGNTEGLKSGAWWFYYKMGFRPVDANVKRVLAEELRAMEADPSHRSSLRTLRKLASENVLYFAGRQKRDVMGRLFLGMAGAKVTGMLAERFGSSREAGIRACAKEGGGRLGVRSTRGWTAGERLAWNRWAPIVTILPGLDDWSADERRALIAVIRAKGGKRESEFVRRFDAHPKLRAAVVRLAES